jgi:glycosyltransferase involved in cell wall biosynthesis
MADIILSICIPTYNRGDILRQTLQKHVSDPAFDATVEIVISDNASTDNTAEVCREFEKQYSNIFYYKNEENIFDDNFSKVLSYGNGLYLKLMNDTATFNTGVLGFIKKTISDHFVNSYPIFFYQKVSFNLNKTIEVRNLNDFVSNVSFWNTWILNFGIWKEDYTSLPNKNQCSHLKLVQSDWSFRIIANNQKVKIYFDDFYSIAKVNNKGGYNVFKVFCINYLSLYDHYLKTGILRKSVFRKEKYRLFRYFLVALYRSLIIEKNKNYTFDKDKYLSLLLRNYKYKPYFYLGISYLHLIGLLNNIKIKMRKLTSFYGLQLLML